MGSVKDFKIHKSELLTDLLDLELFLENSGRQAVRVIVGGGLRSSQKIRLATSVGA